MIPLIIENIYCNESDRLNDLPLTLDDSYEFKFFLILYNLKTKIKSKFNLSH